MRSYLGYISPPTHAMRGYFSLGSVHSNLGYISPHARLFRPWICAWLFHPGSVCGYLGYISPTPTQCVTYFAREFVHGYFSLESVRSYLGYTSPCPRIAYLFCLWI